ncbi:hornerin [Aethina tumida]|uniref:hornerin n=1 Tax=Aethina tumida TaxID=116153 RepID=UPI002147964D|nr:hornerin [Aethina tumida]
MKIATTLLLASLGLVAATPNGVYHQEYNYRSSSSSYRNNELQHKNDDSGYYSKDGDLEGRLKPKINSHNEHSEYVNPKLQTNSHTSMTLGENGMNSYGELNAQNYGAGFGSGYGGGAAAGYGSSSRYGSSSNYGASSSYGSSYGASSIQSLTQNLQAQLERQLQDAIYESQRVYGHSSYSNSAMRDLEEELRRNLTARLQDELHTRYGSQTVKGGLSYTIRGGRVEPTANYNNQELTDLTRQIENNLLRKLHTEYGSSSSHSSSASSNSYNYQYTSTHRPYSTLYPNINIHTTTYRPYYSTPTSQSSSRYSSSQYMSKTSQSRYTPVSNPLSITVIASNVQNNLDRQLNDLLESVQTQYFTEGSSYGVTNYDIVLKRLQDELKTNLTYLLDEELRRNYGSQTLHDGYWYSLGPNGQQSQQYNYNSRDLENLKSQIERNLLQKLNSDFENRRSRFEQHYRSSSSSSSSSSSNYGASGSYGTHYGSGSSQYAVGSRGSYGASSNYGTSGSYGTNTLENYSTRPSANHLAPLISAGQQGIKTHNNNYRYVAGAGTGGYEMSGNLAQLQRELQESLSRQLQQAISQTHYTSGYSSGSFNSQDFQNSLQQLSDELNRNLTRQLQDSSYSYSSSGITDQQMASLRNQLQGELQRQLQQGLRQSWSSSSSYSASASSSNFRPVRGLNGQLRDGEDCQYDDPNVAYRRQRRHAGYGAYLRSAPIPSDTEQISGHYGGHSQTYRHSWQGSSSYNHRSSSSASSSYGWGQRGQQQIDLGQQVEDDDFGRLDVGQQQQQQQVDLGQQIEEEDDGFAKLQTGQQQVELGQEVEDDGFVKLQTEQQQQQQQQQINLGGQFNSLGQKQIEDDTLSKIQVGNIQNHDDQQLDLGQEIEDDGFTKLQVGNSNSIGKLKLENQHQEEINLGQQADLGQKIENDQVAKIELDNEQTVSSLGKSQFGSQQRQQEIELGQQQEELGQEIEEDDFGKTQVGAQYLSAPQQPIVGHQQLNLNQQQLDLGQQIEDDSFSKLTNQQSTTADYLYQNRQQQQQQLIGQEQIDLGQQQVDLGQQIEEDSFEKLQAAGKLLADQQTSTGQQQIGQVQEDLGQQVEEDGFTQLQTGGKLISGQNQQQLVGQEQIDLGQQVEQDEDDFGKLQIGQQQQQLQENTLNKIQMNGQFAQQNQQAQQSVIGLNENDNKFYHQTGYANLNQKIEDQALGIGSKPKNNLQDANKLFASGVVTGDTHITQQQQLPSIDLGQQQESIDDSQQAKQSEQKQESLGQSWITAGQSNTNTASLQTGSQTQQESISNTPFTTSTIPTSQVTIDQQSISKAEAEADALIEAIRASRRRQPQPINAATVPYRGYSYGGTAGRNTHFQTAHSYSDGFAVSGNGYRGTTGRGDITMNAGYTGNVQQQPEVERGTNVGSSGYGQRQIQSGYSTGSGSRVNLQYGNQAQKSGNGEIYESRTEIVLEGASGGRTGYGSGRRDQTGYSGSGGVHYGSQHNLEQQLETTQDLHVPAPEFASSGVQSGYGRRSGVKGGRRPTTSLVEPVQVEKIEPAQVELIEQAVAVETTTTEKPSWWKRVGNKVKDVIG